MTSVVVDNEFLYENEIKNDFLSTLKEDTAVTYRRILKLVQKNEKELGKGISTFDKEDMKKVLSDFKANNINTLAAYNSSLSRYLEFCVNKDFVNKNVSKEFSIKELHDYISSETYLSEKKLRRIEDQLANYQDAVILRLIFEGVSGRGFTELLNLRKQDINYETNTLHLRNEVKPSVMVSRDIVVSDRAIELIKGAIDQKKYYKLNGASNRGVTSLYNTDYVIRASTTTKEQVGAKASLTVMHHRIKIVEDYFGFDRLKAKLIQRSGMLNYALSTVSDVQNITLDDIKRVAIRFNIRNFDNLRGIITPANLSQVQE